MGRKRNSDEVIASVDASVPDEESIADELRRRQVSRRRLIKGAAAVGVGAGIGVAVWSSPSIRTLGQTPAYASTCTADFIYFTSGSRNVDCSCADSIKWHTPIPAFTPTPPVGFLVTIPEGNVCSDVPRLTNIVSPGLDCEISRIELTTSNAGGAPAYQTVPSGSQYLPIVGEVDCAPPQAVPGPGCLITQGPNNVCNTFWRVVVQCVPEGTTCDPPIP